MSEWVTLHPTQYRSFRTHTLFERITRATVIRIVECGFTVKCVLSNFQLSCRTHSCEVVSACLCHNAGVTTLTLIPLTSSSSSDQKPSFLSALSAASSAAVAASDVVYQQQVAPQSTHKPSLADAISEGSWNLHTSFVWYTYLIKLNIITLLLTLLLTIWLWLSNNKKWWNC